MIATLGRCGCQVWRLNATEQAPLLSTRRGSEWAHVWGIVSDNVDWAVVPGVRLIPSSFFDLDGSVKPRDQSSAVGWLEVNSFRVAYTSADLVAEHLRLGHPPKEEELKEYVAKGLAKPCLERLVAGKGKGQTYGRCNWPYKWWNDSVGS